MAKGRKPTPTALKKLRGTDQPCRINPREIKVDALAKLPSAPRWFSRTQRKIYKSKGDQLRTLNVLTPLDLELFISFCREYGNYIDTSIKLEDVPVDSFLPPSDESIFNRISKINKESWERAKSLAAEFGFSPSARAKLVSQIPEDPEENDFS